MSVEEDLILDPAKYFSEQRIFVGSNGDCSKTLFEAWNRQTEAKIGLALFRAIICLHCTLLDRCHDHPTGGIKIEAKPGERKEVFVDMIVGKGLCVDAEVKYGGLLKVLESKARLKKASSTEDVQTRRKKRMFEN